MGAFICPAQIASMDGDWREIEATVDAGATYTVLPAGLLRELGVAVTRHDVLETDGGGRREMAMGRVWITINGVTEVTPVVFGPDGAAPMLGTMTLRILALDVDRVGERLVPRPSRL